MYDTATRGLLLPPGGGLVDRCGVLSSSHFLFWAIEHVTVYCHSFDPIPRLSYAPGPLVQKCGRESCRKCWLPPVRGAHPGRSPHSLARHGGVHGRVRCGAVPGGSRLGHARVREGWPACLGPHRRLLYSRKELAARPQRLRWFERGKFLARGKCLHSELAYGPPVDNARRPRDCLCVGV